MFKLPPLPYDFSALEPHIDARTMEIHYSKHHQGYIDKLNAALENHPDFQNQSVEDLLTKTQALPQDIRTTVINNGGGHANHSFFWPSMSSFGGGEPQGDLAQNLNTTFGSFAAFKEEFSNAAATQFGSGWAWLVLDHDNLKVINLPNQDSPLSQGLIPLLNLDVWEHAYYLKYQNRRADYINAWWNTVNWQEVDARYHEAVK